MFNFMKLLIYNFLFWFKPNKNKFIKSDETYIYSHPDYFSYLVSAISKVLKKEVANVKEKMADKEK